MCVCVCVSIEERESEDCSKLWVYVYIVGSRAGLCGWVLRRGKCEVVRFRNVVSYVANSHENKKKNKRYVRNRQVNRFSCVLYQFLF